MGYRKGHKNQERGTKMVISSFLLIQQTHDPLCVFLEKVSQRPIHASVILMFLWNESFETVSSVYLSRTMSVLLTMKGGHVMRLDVKKFHHSKGIKLVLQPGAPCSFELSAWLE